MFFQAEKNKYILTPTKIEEELAPPLIPKEELLVDKATVIEDTTKDVKYCKAQNDL